MRLWELDGRRLPSPLRNIAQKELHLWVAGWLRARARRLAERRTTGLRHLFFAVCDHYEPLHGNASFETGLDRVMVWRKGYPELAGRFADASGRPPRHSFFFPGEQYDGRFLEPLGELVERGFGEVEVHLHHDGDTRETLRGSLTQALADLGRHGLVPAYRGKPAWAFIHGNWCLANARRDGRWCGVDDEMPLLYDLGCYADFTFPSAPDQCQPGIVNAIYYPTGDIARRRGYEQGEPVRVGTKRQERLLLLEGPLALARRPKRRLSMRIESAALDASDPPSEARLQTWLDQDIRVEGRPEWTFVKVHTHGAPEANAAVLLGEPMLRLHEALRRLAESGAWQLHYVTAREMYNLARAAMDGHAGSPDEYRNYEIPPPPRASR